MTGPLSLLARIGDAVREATRRDVTSGDVTGHEAAPAEAGQMAGEPALQHACLFNELTDSPPALQ